jgi:hypothetical protein
VIEIRARLTTARCLLRSVGPILRLVAAGDLDWSDPAVLAALARLVGRACIELAVVDRDLALLAEDIAA